MYKVSSCCIKKNGASARTTIKNIDIAFFNICRPGRYHRDNGPPFDSTDFKQYMESLGIKRDPSYPCQSYDPDEAWMKTF